MIKRWETMTTPKRQKSEAVTYRKIRHERLTECQVSDGIADDIMSNEGRRIPRCFDNVWN